MQNSNRAQPLEDDALAVEELLIERLGQGLRTYRLGKSVVTIGRDGENDIVLADGSVSRHHARLEWTQGIWRITELGSTNGTQLDSQRLIPGIVTNWQPGSVLQIGNFALRLRTATGEPPPVEQTHFLLPQQVPLAVRVQRNGQAGRRDERPFSVSVWPTRAVDNSRIHIAIQNEANITQQFQITTSATEQLTLSHREWQLEVGSGVESRILFTLRVRRRPIYGAPRHYPFQIAVTSQDGVRRTADGTAEARPLLSNTSLLVLAMLLVSLLATAFLINFFG